MPLQTFSKSVQSSLQNGDLWYNESFKSQFICELGIFYRVKNINLTKSSHYKDVGMTVLHEYPKFKSTMSKICDEENVIIQENNNKVKSKASNARRSKSIQPWVS